MRFSFAVTTSNIRKDMAPARVTQACNQVHRYPGINMGQEIEHPQAQTAWAHAAHDHGKTALGIHSDDPVSVPNTFPASVQVHPVGVSGREAGHPGVQPQRSITDVTIPDFHGVKCKVFNCHTVNKPFVGNHKAQQFRNQQWTLYLHTLTQLLNAAHAAGFMCIYGGDMNGGADLIRRVNRGPLLATGKLVITSGLDHIWVSPPPGHRVLVTGRFSATDGSDHRARHVSCAII